MTNATRTKKSGLLDRRSLFTGTAAGALALSVPACAGNERAGDGGATATDTEFDFDQLKEASWSAIRQLFPLTSDYVYMVNLLLASHPKPVQDEIDRISAGLNENPALYLLEHYREMPAVLRGACADFLGTEPEQIGLTDSTTMGLGLLYGGLALDSGDEILSSTHDHNATYTALELAAQRNGVNCRRVALYDSGRDASTDQIVRRVIDALGPRTRVVALTWVHSSYGTKLPIRAIADALAKANQTRAVPARLFVDGVHGFGVEDFVIDDLGCDAFAAGCHKWIWGPRGTGLVWGNDHAWELVRPTMTAFEEGVQDAFLAGESEAAESVPMAWRLTPGGFHSFENRWALPKAFELHNAIGRQRIAERIHRFTSHMVKQLDAMPHVTLHTPLDTSLQSCMACFEVEGYSNSDTIRHLLGQGVIGSTTPYNPALARFTPAVTNTEEEVETALRAVSAMKA